jgi:hypothetical protein
VADADASVALAHAFQGTGLTVDAIVKAGRFSQRRVAVGIRMLEAALGEREWLASDRYRMISKMSGTAATPVVWNR